MKIKIITLLLLLPSVVLAQQDVEKTVPTKPQEEFARGWVVSVRQVLLESPEKEVISPALGQFVSTENPIMLNAHTKKEGLAFFTGIPFYEFEGFFKAKEKGDYIFIATVELPQASYIRSDGYVDGHEKGELLCEYQMLIEGVPVITFNHGIHRKVVPEKFSLVGVKSLSEGLYQTKQTLKCKGKRGKQHPMIKKQKKYVYPKGQLLDGMFQPDDPNPIDEVKVFLRVLRPSERVPLLATGEDFVHRRS